MAQLLTTGELARKFDVSRSRVDYALAKSRIQERGRAGIMRLFSVDQLAAIEAAINSVQCRSGNPSGRNSEPPDTNNPC